jgi:hypothetical protein
MSVHGLEEVFARFRALRVGVAPYQMPSFAIESVLRTYLASFRGTRPAERLFADLLSLVLQHPLQKVRRRDRSRRSLPHRRGLLLLRNEAGERAGYGDPAVVTQIYAESRALRRRFPLPYDIAAPDNLMRWAMTEGRESHAAIAAHFDGLEPFAKSPDPGRRRDRTALRSLPPIPDPEATRTIDQPASPQMEAAARSALKDLAAAAEAAPSASSNGRQTIMSTAERVSLRALRRPLQRTRMGLARLTARGAARSLRCPNRT